MDKKSLTEADIRSKFIDPAINAKGWTEDMILREKYITDGRVIFNGSVHARKEGKKPDYILYKMPNMPIAVIEAKDNNKPIGGGMQQAMDYAKILDAPFAYSSNGDGFIEHDFMTSQERDLTMDEFPTPDELYERWLKYKNFTPEQQKIVEQPYYFDPYSHELRYYQAIAVNRTVEAIAAGENRVLIVMATGTGKTITAFQIIHRLRASGLKKKIL